jgi:hypothetical protein
MAYRHATRLSLDEYELWRGFLHPSNVRLWPKADIYGGPELSFEFLYKA